MASGGYFGYRMNGGTSMKHISIGGLDVSRLGLGAMSMAGYYNIGAGSDDESIRTIHRALDLGVTHIDTAEIYGPYSNEELVGRAIKGRRQQVVLATKFGLVSHSVGHGFLTGTIRFNDELSDDDWRKTNPRFSGENFQRNLRIVDEVRAVAAEAEARRLMLTAMMDAGSAGRRVGYSSASQFTREY